MSTTLTGVVGTLPLPNTATAPVAGELVQSGQVQIIAQALLDQDATLENFAVIDDAGRPGGNPRVVTFNIGITAYDGVLTDAVIAPVTGPPKIRLNATNSGEVDLAGTAPAPTADPGANNRLQNGNLILAHGKIDINNGVVTIKGGYNTASVAISGGGLVADVTFARPMATSDYTITLTCRHDLASGVIEYPSLRSQNTTGFSCNIRDLAAAAGIINLTATHPGELYFIVTGSQ